ncbi:MAG: Ku protein [Parachlamydia sp.]|nr:Ku protein [Parachlamydia sp.]
MRAIWSGLVSFGLINVPIKLYSATDEHAISFDMLHKTDLSPIRYARICKEDGKEIPYKDIVKGYEYQKGEYIVFTEEDFKRIDVKKTGTIEIVQFTKSEEIDSIYFEKPYYLEPDKGGAKPYALLREALKASGTVAVAKFVFRNRESLGIIKPYGEALILDQMRFASEIRPTKELNLPEKSLLDKKEIGMALELIEKLTDKFKPEAYRDEYTQELQKAIDAKVKGIPIGKKGKAAPKVSKIHDISALLKESLEELRRTKKPARRKAG